VDEEEKADDRPTEKRVNPLFDKLSTFLFLKEKEQQERPGKKSIICSCA
jgi:hypothetical protein